MSRHLIRGNHSMKIKGPFPIANGATVVRLNGSLLIVTYARSSEIFSRITLSGLTFTFTRAKLNRSRGLTLVSYRLTGAPL